MRRFSVGSGCGADPEAAVLMRGTGAVPLGDAGGMTDFWAWTVLD